MRPLVGRSFGPAGAWPPADPVVAVLRPEGAIAFVRVGWGGELGAVTGINASGLFVAVNPTATEDAGEGEVPVAILGRQLLERAHSLDEALAILKQTKPLGAATFLLVDGAGHWMVVERSPGAVAVARDKPRAAIGDFLAASEFAKDADNQRTRRARGGAARLLRLGELLGAAVAEPTSVAAVLRDRRGPAGAPLPGWSPQAVADLGAQHTVVVDPAEMILWVGEGPGGAAGFRAFDLRAELLGAAPRQLTALPADPEMAPEGIPKIVEALRELARADRLVRRGEGEPAAEAAWRALALAPDLALPHKLLGDIARAAGDGARARAHYRRFLELGPRDESAADAVRAYQGL